MDLSYTLIVGVIGMLGIVGLHLLTLGLTKEPSVLALVILILIAVVADIRSYEKTGKGW